MSQASGEELLPRPSSDMLFMTKSGQRCCRTLRVDETSWRIPEQRRDRCRGDLAPPAQRRLVKALSPQEHARILLRRAVRFADNQEIVARAPSAKALGLASSLHSSCGSTSKSPQPTGQRALRSANFSEQGVGRDAFRSCHALLELARVARHSFSPKSPEQLVREPHPLRRRILPYGHGLDAQSGENYAPGEALLPLTSTSNLP